MRWTSQKFSTKVPLSRLIDSLLLRPRPLFSLRAGFMTHRFDVAHSRDVLARWCALAERRLEYLTELFESGRWRRYHSERAFLENIQEAKAAVELWRDLSTREANRDNSAVDISWLGRARAVLPAHDHARDQVHRLWPEPAPIPAEPLPSEVSIVADSDDVLSNEVPSAPYSDLPASETMPDRAPEPTLDLTVLALRYPLLRNAM
jgi:uncharacterized repeat protein (TIGR03809 family)